MPLARLLPVLPRVALGFHQASSFGRRQLLSTACNGETPVACNNGPSCMPWQEEPGVFIRSGWVHDLIIFVSLNTRFHINISLLMCGWKYLNLSHSLLAKGSYYMVYHSQAWQDEFVANILNFKRDGYYLDVGSSHPNAQSNSYFFDSELGWKGVCVELGSDYNETYAKTRTCHFINADATQVDYKAVLDAQGFPARMDYLSVDIDEGSAKALNCVPLDHYRFSVVTIEHDSYRFGHVLRNQEREVLRHYGYTLLFPDVLVPLGCGIGPNLSFEDWWVDSAMFNMDKLTKLSAEKMYPEDIVALIRLFLTIPAKR